MHIELLGKQHDRRAFDCGDEALNAFLCNYARQHITKNLSRTYVLINSDNQVLGYYTLAITGLLPSEVGTSGKFPETMRLPCALLGRLAVSKQHQRRGHAQRLLAHCLNSIIKLNQQAAISFIIADMKSLSLWDFYQKFGFEQSSTNPLRIFLSVQTLEKAKRQAQNYERH